MYPSAQDKTKNGGFSFIEFVSSCSSHGKKKTDMLWYTIMGSPNSSKIQMKKWCHRYVVMDE